VHKSLRTIFNYFRTQGRQQQGNIYMAFL